MYVYIYKYIFTYIYIYIYICIFTYPLVRILSKSNVRTCRVVIAVGLCKDSVTRRVRKFDVVVRYVAIATRRTFEYAHMMHSNRAQRRVDSS